MVENFHGGLFLTLNPVYLGQLVATSKKAFKMIMMQSSLVPSPLRREREKGSGQTWIAAALPRNAIIEF